MTEEQRSHATQIGDFATKGKLVGALRAGDREELAVVARVALPQVRALAFFGGRLFIGTWAQGLQSLGPGESQPRLEAPELEAITALATAPDGLYLASASKGLWRWREGRLKRVRLTARCRTVWSLAVQERRVFVGTQLGLAVVENGRSVSHELLAAARALPVRDLRALLVEGESLWVGSFGGGVHRLLPGQGTPARLAAVAPSSRVWALGRSPQGLVVGTSKGLVLTTPRAVRRVVLPGPPSNDISALAVGRDGLWVGTFDAGLALYRQGRWQSFDRAAGLVDDWINHLAVQRTGQSERLWVATPRGVSLYEGGHWQSFRPGQELAAGHVNGLAVSGAQVVVASSKGISIHQNGHWKKVGPEQGLPLRSLTAVAIGSNGELWVSGIDGLARWMGGRWQRFQVATGELPDDWVTALARSPRGLWIGTYNRGLALTRTVARGAQAVTAPLRWQHWGEAEGMPCSWVNLQALNWFEDRLWIGSLEGGLLTFSPGPRPRWQRLTVADGLPSPDVTAVVPTEDGRIWVATRGGVVRLGPARAP